MMVLVTLASQDVASVLFPVVPSSRLRFFKEGGVINLRGSMFSLSEVRHSGSSKNQGLYSISVMLGGHGPESDVMLLSFFLGDNTLGSFLGLVFLSLVGFFHGLNFSVHSSMSSTNVQLPVLVLTFTTKVQHPLEGHMKRTYCQSQTSNSVILPCFLKYIEHNIIASCLFWVWILITVISNTKVSWFRN